MRKSFFQVCRLTCCCSSGSCSYIVPGRDSKDMDGTIKLSAFFLLCLSKKPGLSFRAFTVASFVPVFECLLSTASASWRISASSILLGRPPLDTSVSSKFLARRKAFSPMSYPNFCKVARSMRPSAVTALSKSRRPNAFPCKHRFRSSFKRLRKCLAEGMLQEGHSLNYLCKSSSSKNCLSLSQGSASLTARLSQSCQHADLGAAPSDVPPDAA